MYDFNKILINPNIEPLDTNTQRIRRNLLAVSIVAYIYSVASDGIDAAGSSFLGIKFNGLDGSYIQLLLIISILYFLLHFIWAAIDHVKENKLRLTGIVIPMVTSGSTFGGLNDLAPNTDDERQSSIFSWWWKEKERADSFEEVANRIKGDADNERYEPALNAISQHLDAINHKASYIQESLIRFENGFWRYQRSQLLRWLILDFLIPVLLGICAIVIVVRDMIQCL